MDHVMIQPAIKILLTKIHSKLNDRTHRQSSGGLRASR